MKKQVYAERFEFESGDVAKVRIILDEDKIDHLIRRALKNRRGRSGIGGGAFTIEASDLGNVKS